MKKRRVKVIALPDDCVPFNPLDVKYQKNEHYPPNKLDEWLEQSRLHVEDSAWVLANNAHRIECWIMKETLQFVASRGDTSEWIVEAIKKMVVHPQRVDYLKVQGLARAHSASP